MSQVLDLVRYVWIETQLAAPLCVQQLVIPRMHEAKEIVRLLSKPYLPVYQLQGQGPGGPLTVTYIGLDYMKPFLTDLLFVREPVEQGIGPVPFWRCREQIDLSSSDIVIVEAAKHLIRKLPHHNAIILPQLIDHILDIQGDWQVVLNRFHKTIRKNELRLTRKYDYRYEVSHNDQDFEMFYNKMYLPTVRIRYGTLASPMPAKEAYQYFRYGFLFLVTRDGQRVCGGICYPEMGMVRFIILGVINGDQQLIKEGAIGALNCLRIQWANQQGYKQVNFLGSGARLRSKLFQSKRKWGGTVSMSPCLHRLIWIHIRRNTPAVSQFLKENPFVVVNENGKLQGLIVVDDPHHISAETMTDWENHYVTPGLSSLVVRSVSRFGCEPPYDNDPDLVIPIPFINSVQVTDQDS